jgi:hypothetical protein
LRVAIRPAPRAATPCKLHESFCMDIPAAG